MIASSYAIPAAPRNVRERERRLKGLLCVERFVLAGLLDAAAGNNDVDSKRTA